MSKSIKKTTGRSRVMSEQFGVSLLEEDEKTLAVGNILKGREDYYIVTSRTGKSLVEIAKIDHAIQERSEAVGDLSLIEYRVAGCSFRREVEGDKVRISPSVMASKVDGYLSGPVAGVH